MTYGLRRLETKLCVWRVMLTIAGPDNHLKYGPP